MHYRKITVDQLLRCAELQSGKTLHTLVQGRPFRVTVEGGGITFGPADGAPRFTGRNPLKRYVSIFNEHRNFETGPYVAKDLHSASYFVAVVSLMVNDRSDVPEDSITREVCRCAFSAATSFTKTTTYSFAMA